jgi:hypothetical protein
MTATAIATITATAMPTTNATATATATHPLEEASRKMKIMWVGIIESIRFKFLLRKRQKSKRSFLAQSTERETQNGGTKRHKKWQ